MYEDLVKRLRNRANGSYEEKCEGCEFTEDFPPCAHCTIKAFNDAADAIEELQAGEKKFLRNISALEMENENLKRAGRWIPVTERLPESGVHVLAACRVKYVGGGGRSYVCDAFYSGRFKEQRSTEYDDIELDYDEETDEYYLPEGWWEVIRNWEEYGFVGIADFVTHWTPLPQPPKEETK